MKITKLMTGRLNPSGGWNDTTFHPDKVIEFAEAAREVDARIFVREDDFDRPYLGFAKEIDE